MSEQMDLFPRSHADGPDTEELAAAKVAPSASRLRKMVANAVRKRGPYGMTADEVCAVFPWITPYSLRPRLTELADDYGILKRTTHRRTNRRGNTEVVWVAVDG